MFLLQSLVENGSLVPVPEGNWYRLDNRYQLIGTKGFPPLVPVPYEPVLKGLHVAPGETDTFGTGL